MDITKLKKEDGFTAIELVIILGVLSVVAYLVLPIIFPSDSKTPEQYIEEDLSSISEIINLRQMTASVNDIDVKDVYIGNLGVYAAKSQVRHSITIDTVNQRLTYCLRGDYRGVTRYFESNMGILSQPSGSMDCPGFEAPENPAPEGESSTAPEAPTDDSLTEQPAESAPSTEG
jgi:competence protein ComGC